VTRRLKRTTRIAAVVSAAALALSGCGFHGLYSASLPGGPNVGSHPYTVTIMFTDVLDLVPQSNVKVNDVAVGKVVAVSLQGWTAKVKVKVNGDVKLPANARAAITQTSLLGEKFVELSQPLSQPEGQLKSGDTIPLSATGTAPEVEEVLGSLALLLNGGGLQQIQVITSELNKALHGNESAVRDLLVQMNSFVGSLDTQKDKITNALVNINQLAVTLNRQKQSLTNALDTFPQALKILADDRSKFTTLLQSLANLGTVATRLINATQTALTSGLQSLEPVLEQLTAAGSDLPKALKFLLTFPFPIGKTTDFVRGDYANLALHLDLSIPDNVCGLGVSPLCDLITVLGGGKVTKPLNNSSTTKPSSSSVAPQNNSATPLDISALPGLGG
jgi:phospholipid/cholesterol/gamma-HCH transport system substrate-binding protein